MSDARPAVSASRMGALFVTSCGLLMLQVALTKVFSVVLWYHFGFLVISIALLGFAMSGVWLARRPEWLDENGARRLWRPAAVAAVLIVVGLWIALHTRVDAMHLIQDRNQGGLLIVMAVLFAPFFFLGKAVSATLTVHRAEAGKVYSANLLGSGAGCGLAVVLFDALHLSASEVAIASGGLVALGALLYAIGTSVWGQFVTATLCAGFIALGVFNDVRDSQFTLYPPDSKPLARVVEWLETNEPRRVEFKESAPGGARTELIYGDVEETDTPGVFRARTVKGGFVEARLLPEEEADLVSFGESGFAQGVHGIDEFVDFREWTSLSRVDVFDWPDAYGAWGLWGLSSNYVGPQPRQVGITIDTWAMTNVMEWDRTDGAAPPEIVEWLPASLVHRLASDHDVLCIGAGGGMDLLTAKRFGAKKIVGVEINPSVVKGVREEALDFQGRLYDWDGDGEIEVHVAEGRHWLERDQTTYDIVQLSGVDTASTTQAGAFSLSENFLYTREAFGTYLEHTNDGGFVTLTRWFLPDSDGLPRNTLRLFVLAWNSLQDAGIEDPSSHVVLVECNGFSVIIFSRTPFTAEQLASLDEAGVKLGVRTLYHPDRDSDYVLPGAEATELAARPFDDFARTTDQAAWLAAYPYDVAAPTDDRPFFFETSRFDPKFVANRDSWITPLGGLTSHAILVILLLVLTAVSWLFVIGPLLRLRREVRAEEGHRVPLAPLLIYFGSLGLGFILVEVVLAQKFVLFLGNPVYSLAVVLFSVLVFSGVGSAFAPRVGRPWVALAIVAAIAAVYPLVLDTVFDLTLNLPDAARIAISVALLAPLAFFMGMPFPLGLARLAEADPRATAWAWGINGYTSVIGSVLTIVIALMAGFTMVVWIGAGVYVLALLASPFLGRGVTAPEPESTEEPVPWRDPVAYE